MDGIGPEFLFLIGNYFARMARMAFRMARKETPTSAKTASHILARPMAPMTSMIAFTLNAKMMF